MRARAAMWVVGWCGLLCAGGCVRPDLAAALDHAQRSFEGRAYSDAEREFDAVAAATRSGSRARVAALTGAALAAAALHDRGGATQRLEAALHPEVPGASEPAMYHLAELLRDSDRPRALNLYYRAAAGAAEYRSRGFPYHEATQRLLQLSMAP